MAWEVHQRRRLILGVIAPLALAGMACGGSEAPAEDDGDYVIGAPKPKGDAGSKLTGEPVPGTNSDTPDAGAGDANGGSASDAGPGHTATATASLDGKALKVGTIDFWPPKSDRSAMVFVKVEGTGAPPGSDIVIEFTKTGTGCVAPPKDNSQSVELRIGAPANDQYNSADGSKCGLSITKYPTNVGDVVEGSFKGTVTRINDSTKKTASIDITFSVTRTK